MQGRILLTLHEHTTVTKTWKQTAKSFLLLDKIIYMDKLESDWLAGKK